ncbi:class I SAM-dependent methyltransferase [Streptomyces sp. PSKA54]|uniref:Class I SAM-dependent methyltransferase n=1 Tax=Streptomyces himalayensis subsp. aureolus TaxID=2758039 RepID=A0A7W2D570_9ACTN|nr:class I SAM-dependent methyltransferase [Streptomyces himalayensis]MBA4864772.1 class I SAM-dependent methyltransferase [Streptomyces himalayensis subsp. aureolus]
MDISEVSDSLFGAFAGIHALALPRTVVSPPFDGLLGVFYTKLVSMSPQDPAWFVAHADSAPGDVLDLCCGGGRTAVAFAAAGHRVTGVDLSPVQISAAEKRAAEHGVADSTTWLTADVVGLRLGRTFDTVVIGGLSLTLFDGPRRTALLEVVRRHLAPGGRVLLDHTPAQEDEPATEQNITLPLALGARRGFVLLGARRQPTHGVQLTNMYAEIIDADGRTERHLTGFRFRVDSSDGLVRELAGHGLVVRERHRDLQAPESAAPTPFPARELVVASA